VINNISLEQSDSPCHLWNFNIMKNKIFQKFTISKIINQYQIHSCTIIIKPHSKAHLWVNYDVFDVTIPLDVGPSMSHKCNKKLEDFFIISSPILMLFYSFHMQNILKMWEGMRQITFLSTIPCLHPIKYKS
jgi:hypothetical protein